MDDGQRAGTPWGVAGLGGGFVFLALAWALLADRGLPSDVLGGGLPLLIGLGLVVYGLRIRQTDSRGRCRRLGWWAVGGAIVGLAITLWSLVVVSIEGPIPGNSAVLILNTASIVSVVGVIVGRSVTAVADRDQELARSEGRFRALTTTSSVAVITMDAQATIRFANDGATTLFGYSPADLVGESFTTLLSEESKEPFRNMLSRSCSEPEPAVEWTGVELSGRRADGTAVPIETSFGTAVVDGDDLLTGVIRDISDRNAAEQRLQDHTAKVTALHRLATEIIGADSAEQVYQRAADGAVRLFAAETARLAVVEGDQFVPVASTTPGPIADATPIPTSFGYAGRSYQSETILSVDELGVTRSAAPASMGAGGSQSQARDSHRSLLSIPLGERGVLQVFAAEPAAFSDRDEAVAELLAAHVTTALEQLDAEATIRRERDQLKEFASILSHDLRNPLNVAQGHLELVASTADDEHLAAIDRALDRMERLIADLLSLARDGQTVGDTEPVALRSIATRAWDNVETATASLEIESSAQIEADDSRLIQLFENLYRNAVEHGGDGVTVRVGTLENGFYVEDTGPGIPATERTAVFERGYSTSQEGTGFGLAIGNRIVDAHGWQIAATTGRDGGARFEVTGV